MQRRTISALTATFSLALFLAGCSLLPSPAVGSWSGPMKASSGGGMMGAMISGFATAAIGDSPANLELRSNGTGYLKLPSAPEQQITWKKDGDKVLLYGLESKDSNEKNNNAASTEKEPIIGTLSDDKKTLTFDLGPIQFVLAKKK